MLTQDLLQGGAIFQGESLGLQLHPSRLNPPHGHGQVEDALHHATMADPQERLGGATRDVQGLGPRNERLVVRRLALLGAALPGPHQAAVLPRAAEDSLVVDEADLGGNADPHPPTAPRGVPACPQLRLAFALARPVELAGVQDVLQGL